MHAARFMGLILPALAISALPLRAASTGHFERTLQVSGQVDLDVTSGSGNITVRTGGSGTVSVSAKIRASNSWLFGSSDAEERISRIEKNPPVEQHGNTIRIGRFEDRELARNISIDYELTVPAQTRLTSQTGSGDQAIGGVQLPLNARTGSGNITVDDVAGDARISSGSGELRINNIKGGLHAETGSGNIRGEGIGGEIVATAGSGDVEVHQVAAGDIKVETGSGNVKLRGIKGGLRASTGSGDIQAEGEATHDWRLGAGSGNITLRLPAQASFDLDARTSSGTLRLNRPVTTQGTISKSHVQGKVGGGGVILDVHTGSGDIALD
jgi:hypothetical protein